MSQIAASTVAVQLNLQQQHIIDLIGITRDHMSSDSEHRLREKDNYGNVSDFSTITRNYAEFEKNAEICGNS